MGARGRVRAKITPEPRPERAPARRARTPSRRRRKRPPSRAGRVRGRPLAGWFTNEVTAPARGMQALRPSKTGRGAFFARSGRDRTDQAGGKRLQGHDEPSPDRLPDARGPRQERARAPGALGAGGRLRATASPSSTRSRRSSGRRSSTRPPRPRSARCASSSRSRTSTCSAPASNASASWATGTTPTSPSTTSTTPPTSRSSRRSSTRGPSTAAASRSTGASTAIPPSPKPRSSMPTR